MVGPFGTAIITGHVAQSAEDVSGKNQQDYEPAPAFSTFGPSVVKFMQIIFINIKRLHDAAREIYCSHSVK